MLTNSDYQTDKTLAEGVQTAMQALGIRVIINAVDGKQRDATNYAGKFDWMVLRDNSDLMSVVQNTEQLAPVGPRTSYFHRAGSDGAVDVLPFEKDLANIVTKFTTTSDPAQRIELMKEYQKIYTTNVYGIGLTQYPGALIINKRFANIPPGTPINMYQLGRGQYYPRARLCACRQAGQIRTLSRHVARQAGWRGARQIEGLSREIAGVPETPAIA